jgi:hypothetical protein
MACASQQGAALFVSRLSLFEPQVSIVYSYVNHTDSTRCYRAPLTAPQLSSLLRSPVLMRTRVRLSSTRETLSEMSTMKCEQAHRETQKRDHRRNLCSSQ